MQSSSAQKSRITFEHNGVFSSPTESSAICDSCWMPLDEMDLFEMDGSESSDYVICADCMDAESQR